MAKHAKKEGRRSFFAITGHIEKSAAKPKSPNETASTPKAPKESPSNSLLTLRDELEGHRLRALTELSEIDEYKRIIMQFPDLSAKTKEKFNTAIEENCKTLGRIKALEEILEYKAMNPPRIDNILSANFRFRTNSKLHAKKGDRFAQFGEVHIPKRCRISCCIEHTARKPYLQYS